VIRRRRISRNEQISRVSGFVFTAFAFASSAGGASWSFIYTFHDYSLLSNAMIMLTRFPGYVQYAGHEAGDEYVYVAGAVARGSINIDIPATSSSSPKVLFGFPHSRVNCIHLAHSRAQL
jgi:hypothetical protein